MRFIFTFLFVGFIAISAQAQTQFHHGSYQELVAQAQEEQKHYFIDFYTDWCKPCKKMDKEAFRDSEISVYINQNYLVYKVNPEKTDVNNQLANKFNVSGYPTVIVFDENGAELGRITYYLDKTSFFSQLKKFKKKIPNTQYSEFR